MRKKFKFALMAFGFVASGLLSACSNEGREPDLNSVNGGLLVGQTKTAAYSGGHFWGNTRGHDVNVNMWGGENYWDCPTAPPLTDEDIEAIKALLSKGTPTYNDIILPFENYFVEQVYKGESQYKPTDINKNEVNSSITGSDQMDLLVAYNETTNNQWWNPELDQWGAMDTNHYEHVNNFNRGDNTNHPSQCTQGHQHDGITLMTNMVVPEDLDPNEQFGFHESFGTSHYYNNYIIVQYKGYWYVGFDYEMHKKEAQNANEAKDVERDWNFTDWIVRITPAYHYGETPSENPGQVTPQEPTTPDKCDKCGHPSHDGVCEECNPGEPCGPETPEQPAEKCPKCGHPSHGDVCDDCTPGDPCGPAKDVDPLDHVEVNLTIEDFENDKRQSHLSIHVRSVTDVDVFVPVPFDYLCNADDMAIVQAHREDLMQHGGVAVDEKGLLTRTDYVINGTTVTLYVELGVAGQTSVSGTGYVFPEDGIHVWCDGIDENVISYLRENFNDGITFEVWNYFNENATFDNLKPYFDRATVKFLDKLPDAYVNAFNDTETGDMYYRDCTVSIVEEQRDQYGDANKGVHYNGSPYNDIYKKNE